MVQDSSDLSFSYDTRAQADLSYSYDTKSQHKTYMEKHISSFQQSLDRVAKSNDAVINVASQNWQDATMCVNALCKLLDKILIENQYDSKRRKINLDDESFRERIGKVEGGVQFLLACQFIYSKSRAKNQRLIVSGKKPGKFAIKLTKEREDRTVLVAGRHYLHEYGSRVLLMRIGERIHELPWLSVHDSITKDTIQMIRDNIDSIVHSSQDVPSVASSLDSSESKSLDSEYTHDSGLLSRSYSTKYSEQTFSCKSVDICQVIRSEKPPSLPLRMEVRSDGFEVVRTKKNTGIEESLKKLDDAREALKNKKTKQIQQQQQSHHASLSYNCYVRAHTAEKIARKLKRGHKVRAIRRAFPHVDRQELEEIMEGLPQCDGYKKKTRNGTLSSENVQASINEQPKPSSWFTNLVSMVLFGHDVPQQRVRRNDFSTQMASSIRSPSNISLITKSESGSDDSGISYAYSLNANMSDDVSIAESQCEEYTPSKIVDGNFVPSRLSRNLLRQHAEQILMETQSEQKNSQDEQRRLDTKIQQNHTYHTMNSLMNEESEDDEDDEAGEMHRDNYVHQVISESTEDINDSDHVEDESDLKEEQNYQTTTSLTNEEREIEVETGEMHGDEYVTPTKGDIVNDSDQFEDENDLDRWHHLKRNKVTLLQVTSNGGDHVEDESDLEEEQNYQTTTSLTNEEREIEVETGEMHRDEYVTPTKGDIVNDSDQFEDENDLDRWHHLKRNKVTLLQVTSTDRDGLEFPAESHRGEDVESDIPAYFQQPSISSSPLQKYSSKSPRGHAIRLPLRSTTIHEIDIADAIIHKMTSKSQDIHEELICESSSVGACQPQRLIAQTDSATSNANSSIMTTSVHGGSMEKVIITFSSSSESEKSSALSSIDSEASYVSSMKNSLL